MNQYQQESLPEVIWRESNFSRSHDENYAKVNFAIETLKFFFSSVSFVLLVIFAELFANHLDTNRFLIIIKRGDVLCGFLF